MNIFAKDRFDYFLAQFGPFFAQALFLHNVRRMIKK